MRDDFTERAKRVLQERVGNHCSNPNCGVVTSGPNAHPERSTKIGVAAHITAASAGGPRYDASLSRAERSSVENGIWLCQNCAHFVDADSLAYHVGLLRLWKANAELKAEEESRLRHALPTVPASARPSVDVPSWACPHCGTVLGHGRSVCLGCRAEATTNLTRDERQAALHFGLLSGSGLAILLLGVFPNWLRSSLGWDVAPFWGMGIYALSAGVLIAIFGGAASVAISEHDMQRKPPRFFRRSIL
jgi:rubrerythrin